MNFYIPEKASIEEIEANVERIFDMAAAAFVVGGDTAEEGSYDDYDNENEGEDDANDEDAVDDGNENNNDIVATSTCPGARKTAVCSFDTKTALSRATRRSMAVLLWRMHLITTSAGRNCTDSALS
jgi:hypothetical protein